MVVRRRAAQRPPLRRRCLRCRHRSSSLTASSGSAAGAVGAPSAGSPACRSFGCSTPRASSATGWSGTRARSSRFLATMEWMGVAARVGEAPDRLFSLFVFLHIGLPLALLAGMWVHVQRLGRPKTVPPRALLWGCVAMLFALRVASGRVRAAMAPRARRRDVAVDWFYQFIHPLMYATSPDFLWALALGATALLLLDALCFKETPPHRRAGRSGELQQRAAAVSRIVLTTRSRSEKAVVLPERCAACGICAGACPSSTPFRSIEQLVSGIELPDQTMQGLRAKVQAALPCPEMVFCCEKSPVAGAIPRCAASPCCRPRWSSTRCAAERAEVRPSAAKATAPTGSAWSCATSASPAGASRICAPPCAPGGSQ